MTASEPEGFSRVWLGWALLGWGLLFMIAGGEYEFCEAYANRCPGSYWEIDPQQVPPTWPPTISDMCADFSSVSGRMFFAFMLLGGGLLLNSKVIEQSFVHEFSFEGRTRHPRKLRLLAAVICIGVMLVGMCPTKNMRRDSSLVPLDPLDKNQNPRLERQNIGDVIHYTGAACAFLGLPFAELLRVIPTRNCRDRWSNRESFTCCAKITGLARACLALTSLSLFVAFGFTYVQSTWDKHLLYNRRARTDVNKRCFWLEFSVAHIAMLLLAFRIAEFHEVSMQKQAPHWSTAAVSRATELAQNILPVRVRTDPVPRTDPESNTGSAPNRDSASNAAGGPTILRQPTALQMPPVYRCWKHYRNMCQDDDNYLSNLQPGDTFLMEFWIAFFFQSVNLALSLLIVRFWTSKEQGYEQYCCACPDLGYPCVAVLSFSQGALCNATINGSTCPRV